MRDGLQTNERGRVRLTEELEIALAARLVEETAPLADAKKLGGFLVQMTPAFSPGKHELAELDGLVEALSAHRVAIELRHRGWVRESRRERTLGWFADRGVAFVCVDAPPGDHIPIMPSGLDAVTRDDLAYVRLHGRDTDGYMTGKSVAERFGWRYEEDELEEVAERVHGMAEQAREVHVAFTRTAATTLPQRPSASARCSGRCRRARSSCALGNGRLSRAAARTATLVAGPSWCTPHRWARRSTKNRPQPERSCAGRPSRPGRSPGPRL